MPGTKKTVTYVARHARPGGGVNGPTSPSTKKALPPAKPYVPYSGKPISIAPSAIPTGGTTGIVLSAGLITWVNEMSNEPAGTKPNVLKIPLATAAAAVFLAFLEKPLGRGAARMLAWTLLATVTIAPLDGKPAPIQTVTTIFKRLGAVK